MGSDTLDDGRVVISIRVLLRCEKYGSPAALAAAIDHEDVRWRHLTGTGWKGRDEEQDDAYKEEEATAERIGLEQDEVRRIKERRRELFLPALGESFSEMAGHGPQPGSSRSSYRQPATTDDPYGDEWSRYQDALDDARDQRRGLEARLSLEIDQRKQDEQARADDEDATAMRDLRNWAANAGADWKTSDRDAIVQGWLTWRDSEYSKLYPRAVAMPAGYQTCEDYVVDQVLGKRSSIALSRMGELDAGWVLNMTLQGTYQENSKRIADDWTARNDLWNWARNACANWDGSYTGDIAEAWRRWRGKELDMLAADRVSNDPSQGTAPTDCASFVFLKVLYWRYMGYGQRSELDQYMALAVVKDGRRRQASASPSSGPRPPGPPPGPPPAVAPGDDGPRRPSYPDPCDNHGTFEGVETGCVH